MVRPRRKRGLLRTPAGLAPRQLLLPPHRLLLLEQVPARARLGRLRRGHNLPAHHPPGEVLVVATTKSARRCWELLACRSLPRPCSTSRSSRRWRRCRQLLEGLRRDRQGRALHGLLRLHRVLRLVGMSIMTPQVEWALRRHCSKSNRHQSRCPRQLVGRGCPIQTLTLSPPMTMIIVEVEVEVVVTAEITTKSDHPPSQY